MPTPTNTTLFGVGGCNCPAGTCTVNFRVNGCGGLVYPSVPTVNVFDHSGGTLLASGTVDATGHVILTFTGTSGTFWVTITTASARFNSYAQTDNLTCGGAFTITLTAATGFQCIAGCPIPLANTLHLTDPAIAGGPVTATLTWTGTDWAGTANVSFPGNSCTGVTCAAATVPVTYVFLTSGELSISFPSGGLGGQCPTATGGAGTGLFGPLDGITACPLSFAASWNSGNFIPGGITNGPFYSLYACPAGGSILPADITLTE